jgi:hypothetical protein
MCADILDRRAAELGDAAIGMVERLPGSNLDNEAVRNRESTESWAAVMARSQRSRPQRAQARDR